MELRIILYFCGRPTTYILLKIIAVAGAHAFTLLKSDRTQFSGLISLTID